MDPRQVVKDFVSRWSDEKLAHVAAFNEDGKMHFTSKCCCLLGVDGSDILHVESCSVSHYSLTVKAPGARDVEIAYLDLGFEGYRLSSAEIQKAWDGQSVRNRIFGEILAEVMAERESSRHIEAMSDPQVDRLFADIQAVQA